MTYGNLYHGTRAGFRGPGGMVLPGTTVGRHNHPGMEYRSDWVYVTPDIHLAWSYARVAKGRGKPKVLIVEPASDLFHDDSTIAGGEEQISFRCTHAFVRKVLREEEYADLSPYTEASIEEPA